MSVITNIVSLGMTAVESTALAGLPYQILGDKRVYQSRDKSGRFYIFVPSTPSVIVRVLNASGAMIASQTVGTNRFSFDLDVSAIQPGSYTVSALVP